MKKVLIIEDEKPAAERLKRLVSMLGDISILAHLESVEEAVQWFKNNPPPDVAFFDIQLADGKSFSIFEKTTVKCPVIFTTAFDEYAIQAFKVNSVDYLLKPVDETELQVAWNKFITIYDREEPETIATLNKQLKTLLTKKQFKSRFLIKRGEQFKFIPTEKVAYFFSDAGNTFLVDSEGKQNLLDDKLETIEGQINPEHYHRISRKFIVSSKSISKITSYFNSRLLLELSPNSPQEVIVSRERVSEFKAWLDK
ncbi:MAG: LytR/AlgR family response regulator transcription factor [Flavobacteriales bacterium]